MLAKLIGAAIILFTCGKIGFDFATRLKCRLAEIRGVLTGLVALESEMTFKGTPLRDALIAAGESIVAASGHIFITAGQILTQKQGETAAEAWETAIQKTAPTLALKKEDLEILRDFAPLLGNSDLDNQMNNIALIRKRLETAEQDAIRENDKYSKLYKSAGLLSGALITILFI